LSADSDFFEEIAKLRAVRRMWYKVMTERYKVKDPRSMAMRFHVQTAGSSLTYQQPLNNAIRAAYQALAAVLGGTQSLHVDSYDEALCIPTEESVKLSIRTQQILQEETNVTNTIDPLGGSYYIEWLTNEVEKKAWEYLEKIEKQGDWVKAVESGWLRCDQEKEIVKHQREVENGQRKVVGVNCFQEAEEVPKISFLRRDPQVYERQKAKLERLRRERDNRKVEEALEELREVTERKENVMPAVMKAVKAYATQGEISNVWSRVFNGIPRGEYLTSSSHLEATGTITL
jgi:methylmalonyl-CoA mutase N-terminal domain/subunit